MYLREMDYYENQTWIELTQERVWWWVLLLAVLKLSPCGDRGKE
jgi:hypothetical protein